MQIILTQEECQIIHEALITEHREMCEELKRDARLGRDIRHLNEMLYKIEQLMKRFEPYLKER